MSLKITIAACSTISSLGSCEQEIIESYKLGKIQIQQAYNSRPVYRAAINSVTGEDRVVTFAKKVTRNAVEIANWKDGECEAVCFGSARGATGTLEQTFDLFSKEKRLPIKTSPTTTAGSIATFAANEISASGPSLSLSMTCLSAFDAILVACSLIKSGACSKAIAGGADSPLTDFSIAQMEALKLYSEPNWRDSRRYASAPLNEERKNTLALGEGAGAIALERNGIGPSILALGFASEKTPSLTGISEDGDAIYAAMKMALKDHLTSDIDLVVLHAPGTSIGDHAEINAVRKLFGNNVPEHFSTKHLTGHTYGASGMLSLHYALLHLEGRLGNKMKRVLCNATGFGGNAISILVGVG